MRLCVFQGTFNPVHNAHLTIANFVKNSYPYDTILFIPAYKPPHKDFDDELANHRYQMVKLAVSGDSFFGISNIEFQNQRFSYTYLTIEELYKRYKVDGKIGFIIGMDAFMDIDTWYEADKLKELVNFIVFPRDPLTEVEKDRLALLHYKGYNYSIAKMPVVDISSTTIRGRLEERKSVSHLVPIEVLEYINENELYSEQ